MSQPFTARLHWLIRDADTVTLEGYRVDDYISSVPGKPGGYTIDMGDFDDEYGTLVFEDQLVTVVYGSCTAVDTTGRIVGFDFQSLNPTTADNIRMEG